LAVLVLVVGYTTSLAISFHPVSGSGNDIDLGALPLKTLTSAETYYVGRDSESFVGITNTDVVF
jgi:hypothetical protein